MVLTDPLTKAKRFKGNLSLLDSQRNSLCDSKGVLYVSVSERNKEKQALPLPPLVVLVLKRGKGHSLVGEEPWPRLLPAVPMASRVEPGAQYNHNVCGIRRNIPWSFQVSAGPVAGQVTQTVRAFICGAKGLAVEQAGEGCRCPPIYQLWSLAHAGPVWFGFPDHRWEIRS
jgi:hypothetical protein